MSISKKKPDNIYFSLVYLTLIKQYCLGFNIIVISRSCLKGLKRKNERGYEAESLSL